MNTSIQEFDIVALLRDMPDLGLRAGQTGTVVFVHKGGSAFEVEFPIEPRRSIVESIEAPDLLKLLNLGMRRAQAG